ncbi:MULTISPECIES: hypothetical protein [Chryseobacterium]|uniref:Uncharacterized protein n=2 Tax=Chryseobacterium gleum TaxID=250 RepID=A0A448B9C4_CHRGE|nr:MULTISPECIES: hypothetical protein [Chryseobacterium]EFK36077.1 hypothetical protein HMPREF0204_15146 [Chryseobacterium gleum ATCC 35910]QQY31779.1 hypothetical protein I6I60_23520 [Chryseobacterium gleum]VEE11175.1 Uncharacterised protein [Chryseobacterium gleum]VFA43997.1 Uncharacterised protein [Chryseobacterium indologenes]
MNIRFETVNEIRAEEQIVKKMLDEAQERLKEEMTKKLDTIKHVFHNETVVVTIDYEKSKASISVENAQPDRIPIIRNAINSLA